MPVADRHRRRSTTVLICFTTLKQNIKQWLYMSMWLIKCKSNGSAAACSAHAQNNTQQSHRHEATNLVFPMLKLAL